MKKVFIYSILLSSLVTAFYSCRKEDNPKLPDLQRVAWLPLLVKDASADAAIPGQDPTSFAGKFSIDEYFESGTNPQKVDVVAIKNGNTADVKMIKADVASFPATVEITGTQLTNLFGPIVLGDNFTIGVDIYTASGQKFEAFPLTGNAYAAGITAQPGASPTINYLAACTFDNTAFDGNYTVVQDDWADFNPGEKVEVNPGPGVNQISVIAYPSPAYGSNRKPMIVDVNPATSEATVSEQVIGDYDGAQPGSTVSGSGTVNPCGDEITLTLTIRLNGVDYSGQVLKLHK